MWQLAAVETGRLWRLGDCGDLQEKIFKFTERWRLARPQRQQAGWLAGWSESESECEEEDLPDIRWWWLPPVTCLPPPPPPLRHQAEY